MPRSVRILLVALGLVAFSAGAGQMFWSSPAQAALEDASPAPGGGTDDPGDEGGDADEVLIRTNPNRPLGDSKTDSGAPGLPALGNSAAAEVTLWWVQALQWLGIRS